MLFQSPPPTDGWEKVTQAHYEVKNTIKSENRTVIATSMIGSFMVLRNPSVQNEFAFIVFKYPALTFIPKPVQFNENTRDEIIVAENYFKNVVWAM